MAGLAPISLQQFINPTTGLPYAGARASFYEASSLDPIEVYSDYGLGTNHSNPVVADAYGRFPVIFIDEEVGFYRLRITTSTGVVLPLGDGGSFDIPVLPVVGPTGSGGGSEVPVDPNALSTTGDTLWVPKTGLRSGWVRMNGRTIGSASSGASERANADTEDLYSYAWTNFADTICAVTGGRGISAASDFAANKPLATIDMRSRAPFGLDDMGSSALSAFTGISFTIGNATTGGSSAGAARITLTEAQMPAHDHGGATGTDGQTEINYGGANNLTASGGAAALQLGAGDDTETAADHTHTIASDGGGAAHDNMPPFVLGTWHWKL